MSEIQAFRYSNPYGKANQFAPFLKYLSLLEQLGDDPKNQTISSFYDWGSYGTENIGDTGETRVVESFEGGEYDEMKIRKLHSKIPSVRVPRKY